MATFKHLHCVLAEGGGRPYRSDVIYTETDLCIRKDCFSNPGKKDTRKGKNQVFLFPGSTTVVLFHDNMYIQFTEGPSHRPNLTRWPVGRSH